MTTRIHCRFCGGARPTGSGRCLGCGAPVANAELKPRKRSRPPRRCPRCGSNRHRERHDNTFECSACSAVFEDADFGFVDDRPEVNAMKKEGRR